MSDDKPTPHEALDTNPDEAIDGADDLPDEVKDGDVSADEGTDNDAEGEVKA